MRFLAGLVLLLPSLGFSQAPDFGGKEQIAKMKELEFMLGRWEGEASFIAGTRKMPVSGYELIESKAGGACLIVSANWTMDIGGKQTPVHQPCAMIFWDSKRNGYRMLSQLANGVRGEFDVTLRERGVEWEVEIPGQGLAKFKLTVGEDGTWREIGERKGADGVWQPFMEMNLKKVG